MLSGYLGWHYLVGGSVIGCNGGSGCDQVLSSQWSAIGGVLPVSGLAAGAYLAMLLASFYLGPATEASVRRLAWQALLVLVGAAAGGAVWFIGVQKWFIGAFCPYCMATHLTSLVLAAVVFRQAVRRAAGGPTEGRWDHPESMPGEGMAVEAVPVPVGKSDDIRREIGLRTATGLALAGLALAGLMAAGQVVLAPQIVSPAGEASGHRLTTVDPHTVPMVGSPDAPYVVTLLFDYECPHCQRVHGMLDEVVRRYGGKVAFALCPAPLNPRCNAYIPQETEAFKDSCELTRIALAVWVAKPGAFGDFDRWMYTPAPGRLWHSQTVEAANAKAIELTGQAAFAAALSDPRGERHLQTSVRIYGETGANAVPKLVFGSHWVNPEPRDEGDLIQILQTSLGLPQL